MSDQTEVEIVDLDHDGEPDRFEHGTELELRPDAEAVDVGPMLDAELVDDQPARQVDQPNTKLPQSMRLKTAQKRPVLAPWMRSTDEATEVLKWAVGYLAHVSAYHAARSPLYLAKLTAWTPWGLLKTGYAGFQWVFDKEASPLRVDAVRKSDATTYLALARERQKRVRNRLITAALVAVVVLVGVLMVVFALPWYALYLLALAALVVFGLVGAPKDKPIAGPAIVVERYQRLTSDMVEGALSSLGIGAMTGKNIRITFPAPIQRDGPGWRAEVDLPRGVTATDVIERRDRLSAGLRRPLGCVWPEPVSDVHAGRLVLWVGDEDMSKAKPATWPLRKGGKANIFDGLPFGTDQRGRKVGVDLMYNNMLIGALPGAGKTFALRVIVLGAAMDPTCELRVYELKGSGDLDPVEAVCHHYGSGADDDTAAECVSSLREVYGELETRAATIKRLAKAGRCPENKTTRELANDREWGLHPLLFVIDECQELFTHPEYGKEAERLCVAIIKRGRALGIMLALATQRPDKDSLPKSISANMGIRFCLRVSGQVENDMILGTSKYQQGIRATMLRPSDKGVGWLVGAADEPQISRGYYIDNPDSVVVVQMARLLREQAGTLTGAAVGEELHLVNVVEDLQAVFGDSERLWTSTILERLAALRPEVYATWSPEQLATALRPFGIRSGQVWGNDNDGRGTNRQGYAVAELTRAGAP